MLFYNIIIKHPNHRHNCRKGCITSGCAIILYMKKTLSNKIWLLYVALLLISCISLVFTNFSYDAEYQLAMAYRLIKGDAMIAEMWEPHQTSAFLCAIIMKFFMMITGSTTGIVLFTQIIGFFIRLGISIYLYQIINKITGKIPGLIAGIMYLLISPKDLLIPEFSNMQHWFSTLMILTFVHYLQNKKVWLLILSASSLCLGVLSYPSFIIAYFAIFFLLLRYSEKWHKDILIYTGICVCIGGAFISYLLLQVGWDSIINCLPKALAIEPSHTVSFTDKMLSHLVNTAKTLGLLAGIGFIGGIIQQICALITRKKTGEKEKFSINKWIFISWYILLAILLFDILKADHHNGTSYPFLLILILGFWNRKLLSHQEKLVYYCTLWTGIINLLATLLLSDHGVLQAIPYMLIAICGSVIPIYHWFIKCSKKESLKKLFIYCVHAFLLLIIFRSIYLHIPISGRGQICSILSDLALIRSGPAMGIITDEAGAAMQRDSLIEWREYIDAGDTIWILGEPVDTLGYLYEDVEVGAPSVMSTPTYNSELLYYWEINPEKYPDVVILASGFGELSWDLLKNDWLMNWLDDEYQATTIIDGNYWRYYFKE